MTANPWTTADLRRMVEHPPTGWDARLAATLLALIEREDVIQLQEQMGHALRTIANLEGLYDLRLDHRIAALEQQQAVQWGTNTAATPGSVASSLHAAAIEHPRWLWPPCHECGGAGDTVTRECSYCGDCYCQPHQWDHERSCWPDPGDAPEDAAARRHITRGPLADTRPRASQATE